MSILIALLLIWILWKLFKFSFWLLGIILLITFVAIILDNGAAAKLFCRGSVTFNKNLSEE